MGTDPGQTGAAGTAEQAKERRELPPLPPDLRAALGDAYAAAQASHAGPRPTLDGPLATVAEHQAWIAGTLEPWREALQHSRALLGAERRSFPTDAPAAEVAAWERAAFVQSVLWTTSFLDESIVRVRIPLPVEVRQDPSAQADIREHVEVLLGFELRSAETKRHECDEFAGGTTPIPDDLEPWARHCTVMVDQFVASACSVEEREGLTPSVHCSGSRRYRLPALSGPETVSMQELTARVEQAQTLCYAAEDVLDDETIEAKERLPAWRGQLERDEVNHPALLRAIDEALRAPQRYATLVEEIGALGVPDWKCPAIERLLR